MIWSIISMVTQNQLDGLTDVVISAKWLCSDSNDTVRVGGTTVFTTPQLNFTPYDQLTESQVLQWIFDALGQEKVAEIEANLEAQIAYQANPPVTVLPNPWAE